MFHAPTFCRCSELLMRETVTHDLDYSMLRIHIYQLDEPWRRSRSDTEWRLTCPSRSRNLARGASGPLILLLRKQHWMGYEKKKWTWRDSNPPRYLALYGVAF
jgi:hypothetical protein